MVDSARALLDAFLQSSLAEPTGEVIGVEEKLTGTIADDLPDLLAIVDLIYQDDAGLHLVDFKTSRSKWGDSRVAEAAEQLRLYQVMSQHFAEHGTDIHLHFGVLVKVKSPYAQVLDVPKANMNSSRIAETIRPIWHAIQMDVCYPNPSMTGCSGCAYRDRCPAHSG